MKRLLTSIAAASVVIGTVVPSVFAASTANNQAKVVGTKAVMVNGKTVSNPYELTAMDSGNTTAYFGIAYFDYALKDAGYTASWNGNTHTWSITASNVDASKVSLPGGVGTGNTTITINGVIVKKINTFSHVDPADNKTQTTYFPVFYVDELLQALNAGGSWNGQSGLTIDDTAFARTIQFVSPTILKIANEVYNVTDATEVDTTTDGTTSVNFGGSAVAALSAGQLIDVTASGGNVTKIAFNANENDQAALSADITAAQQELTTESNLANSVSASDATAIGSAVVSAYQNATNSSSAFATAIQTAIAANTSTAKAADLVSAKTTLDAAVKTFDNGPKATFHNAYDSLSPSRTTLTTDIANAQQALKTEQAAVAAVTSNDQTALGADFTTYQAEVTSGGTYDKAIQAAIAANSSTAAESALASADKTLAAATTTFTTDKTAFDTAVSDLGKARTTLASDVTAAQTALKNEQSTVANVSTNDIAALGEAYNTYAQVVAIGGTYDLAIRATATANTATASTSVLTSADNTLAAATKDFNAAKTTYDNAVTQLADARKALSTDVTSATTLYSTEQARLNTFTPAEVAEIGTGFTDYTTAVTTYQQAIDAATQANSDTASATNLTTADTTLGDATTTFNQAKSTFDNLATVKSIAK